MNLGLVGNLGNSVVEYRLLIHLCLDGLHNESALALVLCACRADVCAYAAACAVQSRNDHCVLHAGELHCVLGLNGSGSRSSLFSVHDNRTDNSMRADECTLVTLDTVLGDPLGNVNCDTALLISSGALRERTVGNINECGNRDLVAALCVNGDLYIVNEVDQELVVALSLVLGELALAVSPGSGNVYLDNLAGTLLDSGVVHVDDIVALLSKGLVRHLLHVCDSVLGRNDVSDGEERGLEHGVGLVAQTDLSCHLVSVDYVEVDVVLSDVSLNRSRELLVQLVNCPVAVQQEGAARNNVLYHIVLVDIGRVMTGNEVCLVDEVCGLDRSLTETQVRNCNAAGLLGVVSEVCLRVHVGVVADDLDGVLVSANGAIRAKTPELAACCAFRSGVRVLGDFEGQMSYIVVDTQCEYRLCGVVVNSDDLSRVAVLGTKTVTSGEYLSVLELVLLLEGCNYIEVQRLAEGTRLLCSVEYGDLLNCCRDSGSECGGNERSVQSYLYKADLSALLEQVVDGLLDGVAYGAHCYDNFLGVRSAIVVEQLVICTDLCIYLVHVLGNYVRYVVVVGVASLTSLEEDIRVLSCAVEYGLLRVEGSVAERLNSVHIYHALEGLVVPLLDLLDLVGGTEAVEEVQERNSALDSGKVSNCAEVHNLLRVSGAEHCITGLATCVDIAVVAEDRKRMRSYGTCGNVDNRRKQLACDLVHIRNHQEKTLRSGVGGGQRTCGKGAVNCTGSARLGLHLNYLNLLAEDVLNSCGGPGVGHLCHN